MSMFCYQCEETAKGEGCTVQGVCGKTDTVANLQDLLVYLLKGISVYGVKAEELGIKDEQAGEFIMESLFATITNANFAEDDFVELIEEAFEVREEVKEELLAEYDGSEAELEAEVPEMATWTADNEAEIYQKAEEVGIPTTENEDINSLRELLTYGLKGISAYADHAYVLGEKSDEIFSFLMEGLAATTDDSLGIDDLLALVMKCGKFGVDTMALLDKANTENYGHPEPTEVELGTGDKPGILVSGHDLRDLEELLEQTKGTGVEVYTHGEMLPAQSYPEFKKYDHFAGNYGGSWWKQKEEFEKFNGPILMTTNCIVPPKDSYKDRVYTTGVVGFDGVDHIPGRKDDQAKDFSAVIDHAKQCEAPEELESGTIMGGFAHNAVSGVADKVVEAVKNGDIKKFFVMGGCDGRHKDRDYYTEFAKQLPEDTVILTAGCAKFRYNKLDLGDIGGIPRVLDAGQCNDSYSLVVIAKKLAEAFDVDDINELPIEYNIAWYEQKAVLVLLALLYLGVEDIHLGPKLPAFVSENVLDVLVDKFNIKPNTTVENDLEAMLA
ncbi:hydroxylamine reductase [Halanaerobacter jeridensis]|uniref:Hydroxylamine reductase n=1 Tax=Halanaerobacter jeridensis TaxID=706427 RepID=A0A938XUN2_9FIRM|nr:hydroxylamine reductase [Halanaerobacter jeridensis]MBM7555887.1 hydroxylamine reductase [Halanaerobacter jeridensis]